MPDYYRLYKEGRDVVAHIGYDNYLIGIDLFNYEVVDDGRSHLLLAIWERPEEIRGVAIDDEIDIQGYNMEDQPMVGLNFKTRKDIHKFIKMLYRVDQEYMHAGQLLAAEDSYRPYFTLAVKEDNVWVIQDTSHDRLKLIDDNYDIYHNSECLILTTVGNQSSIETAVWHLNNPKDVPDAP